MADFFQNTLHDHFNYWVYVILMMIGLWAVIAKNNFIKKLIGLSIFQTAIILFYVSIGVKVDASIPILHHHEEPAAHAEGHDEGHDEGHKADYAVGEKVDSTPAAHDNHDSHESQESHGDHDHHADAHAVNPDLIANPLPHVLMLTAIVVGVATLGVALALSQRIYKEFGTLEESELLEQLKGGNVDG